MDEKVSVRVHCRGKLDPADSCFSPQSHPTTDNSILRTISSDGEHIFTSKLPKNLSCIHACFVFISKTNPIPRRTIPLSTNNSILPSSPKPYKLSVNIFVFVINPIPSHEEQSHPSRIFQFPNVISRRTIQIPISPKPIKPGKYKEINKQSDVKFWLNWIKYGSVSYCILGVFYLFEFSFQCF